MFREQLRFKTFGFTYEKIYKQETFTYHTFC